MVLEPVGEGMLLVLEPVGEGMVLVPGS